MPNQRPHAVVPVALTVAAILTGSAASAQVTSDRLAGDIVVTAQRAQSKGELSNAVEALPAQTFVLDRERVEALPFLRTTDLLRSTPGISFGASSPGGDIGDDISIRGFSSYHGADVAITIDGVPVNFANHGNRHGAADFNWVVPEMIESIEIVKGPFSALYGNFNLSGAINITTRTSGDTSVGVEVGGYNDYRGVATFSGKIGPGTAYLVYDATDRGGYRDHQHYKRYNVFNKYTLPLGDGALSLRLNGSFRRFEESGFLLENDVRSGLVGRRSAAPGTETDGGHNDYYTFVANYLPGGDTGLAATAYVGDDTFEFYDTAFGPPQGFQSNRRTYGGYRVSYNAKFGERGLLTVGSAGQYDDGKFFSSDTDGSRNLVAGGASRDQKVKSSTAGVFAQGQFLVFKPLKIVGGLRYDYFNTDVDNRLRPNSGSADQTILSPKIGAVLTPISQIDIFANTGRGFRSPAAVELSPNRDTAFARDLGVAKLTSSDAGIAVRPVRGLKLTADVFTTTTQRELRRDPANPINVINIGETKRDGYELIAEWQVTPGLRLSASQTGVDTRIKNPAVAGADRVITVPDDVQTLAVSWTGTVGEQTLINADLFVQRLGKRPLRADGSLYAESQTTIGAKSRITRGHVSGFIQAEYRPDKYSSDFVFDLGDGAVFDPRPVVDVHAGLKYNF